MQPKIKKKRAKNKMKSKTLNVLQLKNNRLCKKMKKIKMRARVAKSLKKRKKTQRRLN